MSARKDDTGKPPISLIPRSALLAEARVMAKGREKYDAHNWRGGMNWSRVLDAALRHILAFADGEDYDNGEGGSGELHLANARCCLAFLIEYHEKGLGEDDRYKEPAASQPVPPTYFMVVARDLRGAETVLESWISERVALARAEDLASEWPSFKLFVREDASGYSKTA